MAINLRNLVPTSVMRSDGHMTTVHKKLPGDSAAVSSKLAQAKPSVATSGAPSVHPNDKKQLKVAWRGEDLATSKTLTRLGLFVERQEVGARKMPHSEIYEYLKLGIPLGEAAYLADIMPLENWKKEPGFSEVIPGSLGYVQYGKRDRIAEISNAVAFMQEHGIAPRIAQKMLVNGFMDHHIEGVLTPAQLERLFVRFKYQPSVDAGKDTNTAVTIDALVEGRIPFEAIERGFTRTLLTDATDSLYPRGKRHQAELSDEDREYLISHPEEIVPTINAAHKSKCDFSTAYVAVKEFGAEACDRYSPPVMASKREDGSYVGVDGAERIAQCIKHFDSKFSGTKISVRSYEPTVFHVDEGYKTIAEIRCAELLDLLDAGASPDRIMELLTTGKYTPQQMLAVVRGDAVASLAEGWL